MRQTLRAVALRNEHARRAWGVLQARRLHHEYRLRREHYAALCRAQGLVYEPGAVRRAVRERLAARGYHPTQRSLGSVHTFAFVPRLGWHDALYPHLRALGPVAEFDYVALGYSWDDFWAGGAQAMARRRAMNRQFVDAVVSAHHQRPLDWVFVYASGLEVSVWALDEIQRRVGVPVVGMCLDDKQSWVGPRCDDHRAGQIDIAGTLDLAWTSARVACEWYLAEGGRPLYQPSGCNPELHRPMDLEQDIDVSFIGSAYGYRPDVVRFLRRNGVAVQSFGRGWGGRSLDNAQAIAMMNQSVINLGLGGIGYSEWLTNVKGRDFDAPSTGRGLYLTTFNPDLALHFDVGREIVCYRTRDELLELARHYLSHPEEASAIAEAGRARCLREHTWLHRYTRVLSLLGVLGEGGPHVRSALDVADAVDTRAPVEGPLVERASVQSAGLLGG
jgi:spore maturation protein CgeB